MLREVPSWTVPLANECRKPRVSLLTAEGVNAIYSYLGVVPGKSARGCLGAVRIIPYALSLLLLPSSSRIRAYHYRPGFRESLYQKGHA